MSRSSVYKVLLGAVFALIALRYATGTVDPANVIFICYDSPDSLGFVVTYGYVILGRAIYLIPTWGQQPNDTWIMNMKNTTMSNSAAYVCVVDWTLLQGDSYTATCPVVQGVGEAVGNFVAYSNNMPNTQLNGYGMGAQVAGFAGKRVQVLKGVSSKIGRIVALDPSRQCFENQPNGNRLDASDAEVVLVFHTSWNSMPYMPGTVAVFFNCGIWQPSCWTVACNSLSAMKYYTESIKHSVYFAFECSSCGEFWFCMNKNTTYDIGARGDSGPGSYYLKTQSIPS